jgi:hypothetical protein
MALCSGIRADGGRCKAQAIADSQWCFNHHPDYEEARRRRARRGGKRGGRGRANNELTAIKDLLEVLTDRVLKAEGAEPLETGPAAVANQLINTRLRAIELERKVKEAEELEERIRRLEESTTGGAKWRA